MRLVVVVGGVISGVGKGVITASIGKILQQYGFSATAVKIDPYLNFDAGTLRPTEHGEVWVTYDGGEIDQDLGNYERFLEIEIPKKNNITTGQVFYSVIKKERKGKFLGKTVQIFPHIIEEIKERIKAADEGYDFVLVEIGGTVGDYENVPYLAACKDLERDLGKKNIVYILVTYLPIPTHINEMKTKPTQQAVRALNEYGIFPDFIFCRADHPLDDVRREKIHVFCHVKKENIISAPNEENVYKIPLNFEKEHFGKKLLKEFGVKKKKNPEWSKWKKIIENEKQPVKIAMVGKYVNIGDYELADSYISVNHALLHASSACDTIPQIKWISSTNLNPEIIKKFDGVVVPGGFGSTGVEGKIAAINFVRKNKIPFLGLCYGMQLAVVEYARNVCDLKNAHTTEVAPNTSYPVVDILDYQKELLKKSKYGGTMRLGAYVAKLKKNTIIHKIYKKGRRLENGENLKRLELFRIGNTGNKNVVVERHRHRYEINPRFIEILEKHGIVFSGFHITLNNTELMEFIELPDHPCFIATQAHPEFMSYPLNPSPMFLAFMEASKKRAIE